MMRRFSSPKDAGAWCADLVRSGRTLGFVPTMGALHEGHLGLVRRACAENDAACASVFVNPLQFDDARDFERYPRDFERDARLLEEVGLDMVFTGTLATFFPGELRADGSFDPSHLLDAGRSALGLEGEHRPGHFAGVATIVARLFDVVRPTRAYFGQKDFQQTLVVRDLAKARGGPQIVVCPTSREPSGLARSSRNELLSKEAREEALALSRGLERARAAWRDGERDATQLREILAAGVRAGGLRPDHAALEYAALRDPRRWTAEDPVGKLDHAVALVAARIGGVRLIDNMPLDEASSAECAIAPEPDARP
jgi:pantoate--beta-alanine ligase